jgi:hypothetical protein
MTMAMTNQEFFDRSVAHLRKQQRKSVKYNENGIVDRCFYTHPETGDHCAVGGVMTPELRTQAIEAGLNSASFYGLVGELDEAMEFFRGVEESLASRVQNVHDHAPIEAWEAEFQELARDFKLTLQPLPAPEGAAA